jgi:hypothetical protein
MDKLKALLIGLFLFLGFCLTINFLTINSGFSEDYKYNLTESDIQDEWITQACIKFSINSPECDMVYGGIQDKVSEGRIK